VRFLSETIEFKGGGSPDWNDQLGVWMKLNNMNGRLPVQLPQ
jgi:hypothetical protein